MSAVMLIQSNKSKALSQFSILCVDIRDSELDTHDCQIVPEFSLHGFMASAERNSAPGIIKLLYIVKCILMTLPLELIENSFLIDLLKGR